MSRLSCENKFCIYQKQGKCILKRVQLDIQGNCLDCIYINIEEKILKILKCENVFLNIGMYAFIPVINECDIYSTTDYNLKLTDEEFEKYANEKERVFGILLKKNSAEFIIGSCDLCNCSIDATFKEIEPSDLDFYKKLKEIIDSKIIY